MNSWAFGRVLGDRDGKICSRFLNFFNFLSFEGICCSAGHLHPSSRNMVNCVKNRVISHESTRILVTPTEKRTPQYSEKVCWNYFLIFCQQPFKWRYSEQKQFFTIFVIAFHWYSLVLNKRGRPNSRGWEIFRKSNKHCHSYLDQKRLTFEVKPLFWRKIGLIMRIMTS